MDINLSIDSKFLTKLLETTANGVGAVAGSWLTKRNAIASAEALRIKAQALNDAKDILAGKKHLSSAGELVTSDDFQAIPQNSEMSESGETLARVAFQETKRQKNIRSIFEKASQNDSGDTSSEPVDGDWIAKFFTYAQDVSNEDMQTLWAKILSDEIKKPGTCSIRTLEVIKSMSKQEAHLFESIRQFIIDDFIPSNEDALQEFNVTLDSLIKIQDAGLIDAAFGRGKIFSNRSPSGSFIGYSALNKTNALVIKHDDPEVRFQIPAYTLTNAGKELHRILGNVTYNRLFVKQALNTENKKGHTFFTAKCDENGRFLIDKAEPI